jgi:hypothetical protein
MKRIAYFSLAALALLSLSSCRFVHVSDELNEKAIEQGFNWNGESSGERITASDNYITQYETTGEFHAITCNLPGDVIYTPGECAVSINAPDNVLEHVTVRNENGTLQIKSNAGRIRNLKKITINVSSPVLEDLSFNGAVDFKAPEGITALDFNAVVNGAGDIDIKGLKADNASLVVNGAGDATISELDCENITVAINGAGDAVLSGRASRAGLSIAGAGDIDARKLECSDIDTKVRGVGSVRKP